MTARSVGQAAALAIALTVAAPAGAALAQSPAGRLIEEARAQLGQPNPDSAAALLERALVPGLEATRAEQARAFLLYGIAELMRDRPAAARAAFRQALQRDAALRVDSLAFLSDVLPREFAAERATELPASARSSAGLELAADLPADTTVSPPDGKLRITTRPTWSARVVLTITPAEAPSDIVWSDSQVVGMERTFLWNFRTRDGPLVQPGRYSLRLTAADSLGGLATVERFLILSRVASDTAAMPPPIPRSAFGAETLRVHPGSPLWVVGGVSLAIGTVLLLGNSDPNVSVPVAISTPLIGAVLFLTGRHREASAANIRRNLELQLQYAQRRTAVAEANARTKASAPIRVQVEGTSR